MTGPARPQARRRVAAVLLVAAVAVVGVTMVAGTRRPAPTGPPQSPRRVVSLVPAVTEMLFTIDAGPAVVGVSSFDRYPPAVNSRPRVGALVDPDFERILTLRPDLVVVYGSQTELIGRLERVDVPVYVYRHAGLADITTTMRELGRRVGRAEAAAAAASRLEADLAAVGRAVAGRRRPRTALIFGREPGTLRAIYASGGYGFLHDMLELAGGENVFADVARENLQVSAEILLARAPEVIVELRTSDTPSPEALARERDVWRALPSLPAVRNDRIHILTEERLGVPGPRVAEAARTLAEALHGPLPPG